MSGRRWRADEIEVLFRYPDEGTSLAAVLGRSEDSVTSLARKLGLRAKNRVARLVAARQKNRADKSAGRPPGEDTPPTTNR
jgi:hypothetical protein